MDGGSMSKALEDFTGGASKMFSLDEAPKDLWETMDLASRSKALMCCGTPPGATPANTVLPNGIVEGHAYTVTGVAKVKTREKEVELVRIFNPWGDGDWSDKYALFKLWYHLQDAITSDPPLHSPTRTGRPLVPPETITDMILYPPWNCAIDANVAYGISTGCILPKHREFRNKEPQRALPDRWSSMVALQSASVPKIMLGPMKTDADEIMQDAAKDQIMELYHNHKRLVIPYPPVGLAADFPARPLYEFIAVIGLILKTQSHKATIHLAAGLEYKGHPPPNVQMWQNLYAYTPDGTVMTTKNMERHQALVKMPEVHEALRNLGAYSKVVDADGWRVLAYLSKHCKEISYWIKVTNGAVECLNLVRYLYKQLDRAVASQKEADSSKDREVHIVLVGDGSITNQVCSSSSFVPLETITDTILYSPWNCAIDPKVTYGISAGCILPHHRAFRNGEPQGPLPGHWNSMAAQRGTGVPEIILGPLKTDLDGILKVTAIAGALLKNPDRVVILYPSDGVFPVLPKAMPLSQIVAIIAFLFMFTPSCKATIHLAAGLEYRGRTPPDVNMWQNLYAYTPNGTVMTLQNTELSAELLFREMAKTAEVHDVLGNLGQYSNTIDTNGRKVLESLSNLPCEISHWIRAAGNAILCLNLVRYIYTQLSRAADPQNRDLHIVLVGDGSIANQAHPASWLVPLETITDTILYSPWNCAIDVKVAYSISTGCILPGHRDFRNWEPQGALPEDWNSMAAQQRTGASCKFSHLEIIEGSENFLLGACPLSTSNSWDWTGHVLDRVLDVATSVFRHSHIRELAKLQYHHDTHNTGPTQHTLTGTTGRYHTHTPMAPKNKRLKRDPAGSLTNPVKFQSQDFQKLCQVYRNKQEKFIDETFLPAKSSIGIGLLSQSEMASVVWRRPSELVGDPCLIVDGESRFDFAQGELGNCWFLAAIGAITFQKEIMDQVVPLDQSFGKDYPGVFHFRFWRSGKWVDVVIDDKLPTIDGKLIFLDCKTQNEFWPALLEKAYAKVCGSYKAMSGGFIFDGLRAFTGGAYKTFFLDEAPDKLWDVMDLASQGKALMGCGTHQGSDQKATHTLSKLCAYTASCPGRITPVMHRHSGGQSRPHYTLSITLTAGSGTRDGGKDRRVPATAANTVLPNGIVEGHAYTVTGVAKVLCEQVKTPPKEVKLVRIFNPWGEGEWNGPWSDKMSMKDFCKYYSELDICCTSSNFPNEPPPPPKSRRSQR
ncbi:hypothetical protein NFI96_004187 [Prochilodus magdalenae]|nr:hypothetical protein NFI96_004187 [Prochilodus magdalenae]